MTYDDFVQHLARAGLKPSEFASLMRMNKNSLANYSIKGTIPEHLAIIAALIAEMESKQIDYRDIFAKVKLTPKKARGAGFGKKDKSIEKKSATPTIFQDTLPQPTFVLQHALASTSNNQTGAEQQPGNAPSKPGGVYGGAETTRRDRSRISIEDI